MHEEKGISEMADGNDGKAKATTEIGIYCAMIEAQAEARQIEKDAKNSFHRYNYVSAEAMIHEGKVLFAKHGLALIPVSSSLSQSCPPTAAVLSSNDEEWGKNSRSAATLQSSWLLVHKGGGQLQMSTSWPVVPEKGRPLDKAVAAARTASLSYLLRDILQIPRVEEGTDLDSEDRDREARPTPGSQQSGDDLDVISSLISAALDEMGLTGPARGNRVRRVLKRDPDTNSTTDLLAVYDDLKKEIASKAKG